MHKTTSKSSKKILKLLFLPKIYIKTVSVTPIDRTEKMATCTSNHNPSCVVNIVSCRMFGIYSFKTINFRRNEVLAYLIHPQHDKQCLVVISADLRSQIVVVKCTAAIFFGTVHSVFYMQAEIFFITIERAKKNWKIVK